MAPIQGRLYVFNRRELSDNSDVANRQMSHQSDLAFVHLKHSRKNIVKHTAHTIVSWPNPKQWLMVHTSGLMMVIW